MKSLLFSAVSLLAITLSVPAMAAKTEAEAEVTPQQVAEDYAGLVYVTYWDTLLEAKRMQKAVELFLDKPSAILLEAARESWRRAREPYGLSEAFRFYEGPIDAPADAQSAEGPEARLNAWPLNEAYIDFVAGNPKAGIIQDVSIPITREMLVKKNQADDEAEVSTGYHAIEFLLWGQDLSLESAGTRSFEDFLPGDAVRERRREYLRAVTALLVEDVQFLVDSWEPKEANYAARFAKDEQAVGKILTALATLSGFELASERMATAIDSGDQEDEHSCFSDNTHRDFIANAQGIANVYFNTYEKETPGVSPHDLLRAKDPELAGKLAAQIKQSVQLVEALPQPVDKNILATPEGSPARAQMEAVIASLQQQAELLKQAGKALGVAVDVVSE